MKSAEKNIVSASSAGDDDDDKKEVNHSRTFLDALTEQGSVLL